MGDWWIIERAEHDGRQWFERTGPRSSMLMCSARISDADVEGTSEEMLAIAQAIEEWEHVSFRRCAVDARGDKHKPVRLWSPRNSQVEAEVPYARAFELAEVIREEVKPVVMSEGADE
jgi:hypothetical protein